MWMLFLRREAVRDHRRVGQARPVSEPVRRVRAGDIEADLDGGADDPGIRSVSPVAGGGNAHAHVRVFLHPGRRYVGEMEVAQLCEQFNVDWARPFGSIEEAEKACSGLSGFLAEVSRPFVDPQGNHHDRGALFAKGLR